MAIVERIRLDDSQYTASWNRVNQTAKRGARENEQSFKRVQKGARRTGQEMNWLQKQSQKLGTGIKRFIGTIAVSAVISLGIAFRNFSKEQIEFDRQMTQSLAIMGKVTMRQRKMMETTARDVARELNISADKVAKGYFYLASAGLDVEQQIASLPAVAEFAKAGMFDLATATDLLTDAQSALGLTVDDVVQNQKNMIRVSDVLAKANQMSNATIEQFSESLTNKGATALRSVNKEIEEGVGLLATYADQGIKGRLAGEYLSRTIRILTRAASENRKEFEKLGMIDAEGNLASFEQIVRSLTKEMAGLSDVEKSARFETLGFTVEVQDALKPLLGMSDQIGEYTSRLKDAQGATSEIAEKQMNNLTDRVQKLWSAFKNTFGPAFLDLLDTAVGKLEEFSDEFTTVYNRIFGGSSTEKLLGVMRTIGGDQKIIARLELINAKEQAEAMRDELEKELSETKVPLNVEEKGWLDQSTEFGKKFWKTFTDLTPDKMIFGQIVDIADSIQNYQFESEVFDASKIDEYKMKVQEAEDTIKSISERIASKNDLTDEERDQYTEMVQKYSEQIRKLQTIIVKYEALQEVQDNITDMNAEFASGASDTTEAVEETAEATKAWGETLEIVSGIQNVLLSKGMGGFDSFLKKQYMTELGNQAQDFENKMVSLRNQLDAGIISEDEFQRQKEAIEKGLLDSLKRTYDILKELKLLTPSVERAFREMFNNMGKDAKKPEKDLSKLSETIGDIADGLKAIGNLAGDIDGISDGFADAVKATADLISNLSNINRLMEQSKAGADISALSYVAPVVGVLASGISIIKGLFGGGGGGGSVQQGLTDKEIADLKLSINEQIRALQKNTEAILGSSIVGGNVSRETIRAIQDLLGGVASAGPFGNTASPMSGNPKEWLSQLEFLMPDLFDGISDMFDDLVESGDTPAEAFYKVLEGFGDFGGIKGLWNEFLANFADFGDSLEGAIAEFNASINFGVMNTDEALQGFIDNIKGLGTNISEATLNEIANLDLNTEEGRKRLTEIIATLFENNEMLMGDLTPDEFNELLEFLKGLGSGSGSTGAGSQEFSRSVQIARTITEIQANEVVALLHSQLMVLKDIRSSLRPQIAPAEINGEPIMQSAKASGNSYNFDVDVSLNGSGGIGDSEIDYIMTEMKVKLKEEIRNQGFYP